MKLEGLLENEQGKKIGFVLKNGGGKEVYFSKANLVERLRAEQGQHHSKKSILMDGFAFVKGGHLKVVNADVLPVYKINGYEDTKTYMADICKKIVQSVHELLDYHSENRLPEDWKARVMWLPYFENTNIVVKMDIDLSEEAIEVLTNSNLERALAGAENDYEDKDLGEGVRLKSLDYDFDKDMGVGQVTIEVYYNLG